MIEIKNVTKKYGNKKAVDNVSFNVNEGEIFAFIDDDTISGEEKTISSDASNTKEANNDNISNVTVNTPSVEDSLTKNDENIELVKVEETKTVNEPTIIEEVESNAPELIDSNEEIDNTGFVPIMKKRG